MHYFPEFYRYHCKILVKFYHTSLQMKNILCLKYQIKGKRFLCVILIAAAFFNLFLILSSYDKKHIVAGHTLIKEIVSFYNKKSLHTIQVSGTAKRVKCLFLKRDHSKDA